MLCGPSFWYFLIWRYFKIFFLSRRAVVLILSWECLFLEIRTTMKSIHLKLITSDCGLNKKQCESKETLFALIFTLTCPLHMCVCIYDVHIAYIHIFLTTASFPKRNPRLQNVYILCIYIQICI